MKIEIKAKNRVGISQELLKIFSVNSWDLNTVEIVAEYLFVDFESHDITFSEVNNSFKSIIGFISCKEIDLLPTESREKHLKALLDRLPDPIIDVDNQGIIVAVNQATQVLQGKKIITLVGRLIDDFIDRHHQELLLEHATSISLTFFNQPYVAEVTPVLSKNKSSGAVITLKNLNKLGQQISLLQSPTENTIHNIVGESAKIKMLLAQTLRYAELDLPVFINGETGTGKELIARALHYEGSKKSAPFLAINCASLPEHLLESELFGYSAGAFTGAQKGGKPGLFEMANGGTVFLDEIAEMSVYLQAKLLRFLQDFTFRRIGSSSEIHVNVRVISATHQNISALLDTQKFREDLFYRLNVLNLSLPPLREREDDIPLLVNHFISLASTRVDNKTFSIENNAMSLLKRHTWMGNVRELQNVVFRMVANSQSHVITPYDVRSALSQFARPQHSEEEANHHKKSNQVASEEVSYGDWAEEQDKFEKALLINLYPKYPTTRLLAERLGVSHNKIAMKLRKYGILK